MKHLIIVGARGWGREISWHAADCLGYGTEFDVKGFLDDKSDALQGLGEYPPILSPVETYEPQCDDIFTVALGFPDAKRKYVDILQNKGCEFITLIHKDAKISPTAKIGKGCIILEGVSISVNVTVGDFVTFQRYSTIGHDSVIGSYCMFNSFSFMGGYAKIGDGSELSTHSQIIPHASVGRNCMVGAGSVVIRKVKDNTSVFGVPAMKIEY